MVGTCLALLIGVVSSLFKFLALGLWMILIHIGSLMAQTATETTAERQRVFAEVTEPNLGELLPAPSIEISPKYASRESVSVDLRQLQEYEFVQEVYSLFEGKKETEEKPAIEPKPGEAYVKVSDFMAKQAINPFEEWMQFFRADLLMARQLQLENPRLSLALEEYQLAIRLFPLSKQVPRALYQMALIQLQSGLYEEVNQITARAINEYPADALQANFLLLNGEQAFQRNDLAGAMERFSQVVRRFPKSEAAIDAAFRRGFLMFKAKKYSEAMKTYANLERFHEGALKFLKMESRPSSSDKFLDRVFYAETLFLTANYREASEIFQMLGNLFPRHKLAPYIWSRYADTYLFRNRPQPALALYEFVSEQYADQASARALTQIREADVYFLLDPLQSKLRNEELLKSAFGHALEADDTSLASLALARLIMFYSSINAFAKAKAALSQYKEEFEASANIGWAKRQYAKLVESEILDHYNSNDYLAALTEYLTHEGDESTKLTDVSVLLRLADVALELSLYEKASDILNRVIYLESSASLRQEALLKLISILVHKGELSKASERLRRFNFAYPQSRLDYLYEKLWGDLYVKLGNSKKAASHYSDALQIAKKREAIFAVRHVYLELGSLYEVLSLPLKAIESYREFSKLFKDEEKIKLGEIPFTPKDQYLIRVARYRIADIHFNSRDFVQALRAYRNVVEGESDALFKTHAQFRIGECFLSLNERGSAIEAFEKVSSPDQNNIWVKAAKSFIESVKMEVKNEIRIFN